MTRRRAGRIAALLLLLATVAFAIGIAIEKAEEGEGGSAHATTAIEQAGQTGAESAEGSEEHEAAEAEAEAEAGEAAETGSEHGEETLLGIDVESTPLIVLGVVLSLSAIAALLLASEKTWVLAIVAAFCAGFAVLDVLEVGRKWGDEATIALIALAAAVLHAAAAIILAKVASQRPAATVVPG